MKQGEIVSTSDKDVISMMAYNFGNPTRLT